MFRLEPGTGITQACLLTSVREQSRLVMELRARRSPARREQESRARKGQGSPARKGRESLVRRVQGSPDRKGRESRARKEQGSLVRKAPGWLAVVQEASSKACACSKTSRAVGTFPVSPRNLTKQLVL